MSHATPPDRELSLSCQEMLSHTANAADMARQYINPKATLHSEIGENLYEIQKNITLEFAAAWNEALITALREVPLSERIPSRLSGLDEAQLKSLYWKVRNHPFSATGRVHRDKYDPQRQFGFCFGRAFVAHLEALKMGLVKESIRKIWIVGAQAVGKETWKHHVATMVRGLDGEWYVLDPLTRVLLTLPEWFRSTQDRHPGVGVQLFSTPAERFSPEDAQAILPGTVRFGFNHYFKDLLKIYRAESRDLIRQRKGLPACAEESHSTWRCIKEALGIF